jgi:hypothetical protein
VREKSLIGVSKVVAVVRNLQFLYYYFLDYALSFIKDGVLFLNYAKGFDTHSGFWQPFEGCNSSDVWFQCFHFLQVEFICYFMFNF